MSSRGCVSRSVELTIGDFRPSAVRLAVSVQWQIGVNMCTNFAYENNVRSRFIQEFIVGHASHVRLHEIWIAVAGHAEFVRAMRAFLRKRITRGRGFGGFLWRVGMSFCCHWRFSGW
jgi:hypothetical protein